MEVDLEQGTRSVAVTYAMLESGAAGGQPVSIDDVLAERITRYQDSIDEGLGLTA